jgi:Uma2 family endonuclease
MTDTGLRMTADDLLRLPEIDRRYELIDGVLYERPFNGIEHGFVVSGISFRLGLFLDRHAEVGGELCAGGTGFWLRRDPDTVLAPSLSYVAKERLVRVWVDGYPELAPDLVVEVVSPNDTASEIQRKTDEWLQAGARLVWVLYPATRSAMVYRTDGTAQLLHPDDTLTGEPVLPGFTCRLGDLFGPARD